MKILRIRLIIKWKNFRNISNNWKKINCFNAICRICWMWAILWMLIPVGAMPMGSSWSPWKNRIVWWGKIKRHHFSSISWELWSRRESILKIMHTINKRKSPQSKYWGRIWKCWLNNVGMCNRYFWSVEKKTCEPHKYSYHSILNVVRK